jgi:Flp pilus assembly protein TadG
MRAARACKEATTLAPQPIHKVLSGLRALAFRLGGDRRGNVAIIFALSLPVIVMLALGGVDIHRITTAKAQFQDALDAAALAAARSPYTTPEELKSITLVNLRANLKGIELEPVQDGDVQVAMNDKSVVIATAQGRVKTLVANIVLPPYGQLLDDTLPVSVRSEVNRSSRDVEVALVLDITGSMNDCAASCSSGRKIDNLKSAAKELIDIVVQDNQSPFYSKVALAPYSMGVNVGDTYADRARGALGSSTQSITAATWLTGSVKTITGITRAYTAVVTASNHGFKNGDIVTIWSAETMAPLNGVALTVGNATTNTFSLLGKDSRYYSAFSGRAYVAKCARADCNIVITMARHGLSPDGDAAVLSGMGGLSQLNDIGFRVAGVSATMATLALDASQAQLANAPMGGAAYTSGGQLVCGVDGCSNRDFVNAAGTWTRFPGTTCVSERAGAQAYTDAAPSTSSWVGRSYAGTGNACPASRIVPLTNVKKTLTDAINGMSAVGSTAGHIGLAWGWYLVSPTFGLWSGAGAPAAYDSTKTLKAVVLMTDGEFNTPYFRGVIAGDAGVGSGGADTHINQPATNGSSFDQAYRLCQNMKAAGVIVYTVGFDIGAAQNMTGPIDSAGELMARCATNPDRAFQASSSTDLSDAFRDIGRDITRLRISR